MRQIFRRRAKMLAGDINRDVGRRFFKRVQQDADFLDRAATIFQDLHTRPNHGCHLPRFLAHQSRFRARWIILRQLANLVEEFGAVRIVEVLTRQGFGRGG